MERDLYIEIENSSSDMSELVDTLVVYCKKKLDTHSSAGVEIISLIISVGGFIVALIELPMFIEYINRKEITVKFNGFTIGDSADVILDTIKNDPVLFEQARNAIKEHTFNVEGKTKVVVEFWKKLNLLIQ